MGSFIGAWMGGEVVDITGSYSIMWWLAIALGVFAMVMHLLLDEGPAPQPPHGASRPGATLAPLAVAFLVLLGGTAAGVSIASPSAAAAATTIERPASSHDQPAMFYCSLGPVVVR